MTNRVEITLTDEQKARLEQIAEYAQGTLVSAVEEAVSQYLDYEAEFRIAVEAGLDDAAAGRTRRWDDAKLALRAKHGLPEA